MSPHAQRPLTLDGTIDVLWDRAAGQEEINDDYEARLKALELRTAKWAGAIAVVAFAGGILGAVLGANF